jgi:SAM-dependent methyltransferase
MTTRKQLHADNRRRWDAAAPRWADKVDARELSPIAHQQPERVLLPIERGVLGDIAGQRACVLGSGDNLVAFALAGMGAVVTSVDISQAQLDVAAARARENGLDIDFVCADVCELGLPDDGFDVVYTGGHVAVWVADLAQYYAEATRILRPGGLFLVREYHPFRRLWRPDPDHLELEHGYFARGPHTYPCTKDPLDDSPGDYVQHEFTWTIADYLHAITRAGNHLVRFEELDDERQGWETAPVGGLPHWLLLAARKDSAVEGL